MSQNKYIISCKPQCQKTSIILVVARNLVVTQNFYAINCNKALSHYLYLFSYKETLLLTGMSYMT